MILESLQRKVVCKRFTDETSPGVDSEYPDVSDILVRGRTGSSGRYPPPV